MKIFQYVTMKMMHNGFTTQQKEYQQHEQYARYKYTPLTGNKGRQLQALNSEDFMARR